MKPDVLTVSGYPGSGTSTLVRLLAGRTGLRAVNALSQPLRSLMLAPRPPL